MLQNKLLYANLLNWKKYFSFKIVYSLTLLDLISLLIDEMVRLDGNIKTQVMKVLFKKIQQYIEKNNENYAFQANKRQKKGCLELRD
jgi:chromosome condensin MukBEF complex kleisin-like MukF subunit